MPDRLSTRFQARDGARPCRGSRAGGAGRAAARAAAAVHRRWLSWEDLEDAYSQATVELVAQARRGQLRFSSRAHLRNMLELRFVSRVRDRRRALRGRSPVQATLDGALSLGRGRDRRRARRRRAPRDVALGVAISGASRPCAERRSAPRPGLPDRVADGRKRVLSKVRLVTGEAPQGRTTRPRPAATVAGRTSADGGRSAAEGEVAVDGGRSAADEGQVAADEREVPGTDAMRVIPGHAQRFFEAKCPVFEGASE